MKILIVDDEKSIVESIKGIIQDEGYQPLCAYSGETALQIIEKEQVSLVLMDVWMPGIDGIETLRRMKEHNPYLPVIMISGHGTIDTAVQATKMGAYDFIEKPPGYDKIVLSIKNALHLSQVEKENAILRQKTEGKPELTGASSSIVTVKELIARVAPTNAWVLILGEHGTGKELVAQAIHRYSERRHKPMIEVNCAAIPEELIESELFGHEKGAFTGATASKRGKFDLADGSTLFLDEIADMSLKTQAKILRILQEQKFERVGGGRTLSVDVRVLAATNKDLEQEIAAGRFRVDLYWRLHVVPVTMPPLRERLEDIGDLVADFSAEYAGKGLLAKKFTTSAIKAMTRHHWPGNVRELRNVVERALIMAPDSEVSEDFICQLLGLPFPKHEQTSDHEADLAITNSPSALGECLIPNSILAMNFKDARREFERQFLQAKIAENDGNISKTAEQIGVERSHLHRKIRGVE
ncbi:MAG: sigma-54-dependent Fis family transcriptional regulator [Desulfobulbaceae bacterium]|nr:sigma-54-dependent Fis family transcriptional regulator [Desulfobulbaceae bacterium]